MSDRRDEVVRERDGNWLVMGGEEDELGKDGVYVPTDGR